MTLTLSIVPGVFAIARLAAEADLPTWIPSTADLCSITRTSDELSIVCRQESIPNDVQMNNDWVAFKIEGPLDLSMTGVTSMLSVPLAEVGINLCVIATYDTDYILVKQDRVEEAKKALATVCTVR